MACRCNGCFPPIGVNSGECRAGKLDPTAQAFHPPPQPSEIRNFEMKAEIVRRIRFFMAKGYAPTPELYAQFKSIPRHEFEIINKMIDFWNLK